MAKLPPRALVPALVALGAFNAFGERYSIGELIERTPGLSHLDRLGRA